MNIEYDIPTPRTNAARGFDTVVGAEEMAKLERELAVITLERDEAKFERETVEAESQQLRKQIDENIENYLNEKLCCNGHECGCGGVTRLQQYVMEEAATELGSLRAQLTEAQEQLKAYQVVAVETVPGEHGEGVEIGSSPAFLKSSIDYLQKEWDGAEDRATAAQQQVTALRGALEYYASAPWVGHAGSWAHSHLAKVANDALAALPTPAPATLIKCPVYYDSGLSEETKI